MKKGILTSSSQYSQIKKLLLILIPVIIIGYLLFSNHDAMPGKVKTQLYHWTRVIEDNFANFDSKSDVDAWLLTKSIKSNKTLDKNHSVILESISLVPLPGNDEICTNWDIYLDISFNSSTLTDYTIRPVNKCK